MKRLLHVVIACGLAAWIPLAAEAGVLPPDADDDGFGNICDCDFDQNGTCGFSDFNTFLACFGLTVPAAGPPEDPTCAESDQDVNGIVGFSDFTLFLDRFGGAPGLEHIVCVEGAPLPIGCDDCVDAVCAGDPHCCSSAWDYPCVVAAANFCGEQCSCYT
ncbi:MAG: hypothetical protein ACREDF_06285, partial [Thermoplasmata archaeon]